MRILLHRYESDETPMIEYLGLHDALNARRVVAQQGDFTKGPRVLVSECACCAHEHSHPPFLAVHCRLDAA